MRWECSAAVRRLNLYSKYNIRGLRWRECSLVFVLCGQHCGGLQMLAMVLSALGSRVGSARVCLPVMSLHGQDVCLHSC